MSELRQQVILAARHLGLNPATVAYEQTPTGLILHHGHQSYTVTTEPAKPQLTAEQEKMINRPDMYSREELRIIAELLNLDLQRDWKKDLVQAIIQWRNSNTEPPF